ncbi:MAG: hypothetical protein ACHREM_08755 [Polyangiales bacterium]
MTTAADAQKIAALEKQVADQQVQIAELLETLALFMQSKSPPVPIPCILPIPMIREEEYVVPTITRYDVGPTMPTHCNPYPIAGGGITVEMGGAPSHGYPPGFDPGPLPTHCNPSLIEGVTVIVGHGG